MTMCSISSDDLKDLTLIKFVESDSYKLRHHNFNDNRIDIKDSNYHNWMLYLDKIDKFCTVGILFNTKAVLFSILRFLLVNADFRR